MDPSRGVICRGPEGPYPGLSGEYLKVKGLPSTTDLLREDAFLGFFASLKSKEADCQLVTAIGQGDVRDMAESCNQPIVISTLTQTPIAIANNLWEVTYEGLSKCSRFENGLTR